MMKKAKNLNLILIVAISLSLIVFFYCLQSTTIKEGKKSKAYRRRKWKDKESKKGGSQIYRGGQELLNDDAKCTHDDEGKKITYNEDGEAIDEETGATYNPKILCDLFGNRSNNTVGRYEYKNPKISGKKCYSAYPYQNVCHPMKREGYDKKCVKKKIRNQFCDALNSEKSKRNSPTNTQIKRRVIKVNKPYLYIPATNVKYMDPNDDGTCPKVGYRRFDKKADGTEHDKTKDTLFNFVSGTKTRGLNIWTADYGDYHPGDDVVAVVEYNNSKDQIRTEFPYLFGKCINDDGFNKICKRAETGSYTNWRKGLNRRCVTRGDAEKWIAPFR